MVELGEKNSESTGESTSEAMSDSEKIDMLTNAEIYYKYQIKMLESENKELKRQNEWLADKINKLLKVKPEQE